MTRLFRHGWFLLTIGMIGLSACVVAPPVQEMSDARQAVQSAQDAQAAQWAPDKWKEAQTALDQAQKALEAGDYQTARHFANRARDQAIRARERATARAAQPPGQ